MIVSTKTVDEKLLALEFLRKHGVDVSLSEDFNAQARLSSQGVIMGVVGYNGFCGKVCAMHVAGVGNWISRDFLWKAFDYPFKQVGIVQIISPVAASNHRALKLNKHLGFEVLQRIRDGWADNEDLIFMSMRYNQCRWLREPKHELQAA